jgi:hypothetical protein
LSGQNVLPVSAAAWIDLNGNRHAGGQDHIRRDLVEMDANRDALR